MIAFVAGFGLAAIIATGIFLDYRRAKLRAIRLLTTEVTVQRAEKESYKRVSPFATTNAYWRVCTEQPEMHILDRKPIGKN